VSDADTQARVAKIVDSLTALGTVTKGAPLRADAWNTVVGALLDLARLALARDATEDAQLDARYAPKQHSHIGEVDASWFTPAARDLLDQRTTGGNDVRADLQTVKDSVAAVQKNVADLQDQLKKLQLTVDGLNDKDQVLEQSFAKIDLKVEGLRVLQANVDKLQTSFGTIGPRLDDALAFRNQLLDASGQPISVSGLAGRVGALETNQENLKGPDGKLVRFRDFDARVTTLEGKALTKDNIDSAITDRLRTGNLFDPTAISDQVLVKVRADSDGKFKTVNDRLDGLTAGVGDLTTKVTAHTTTLGDLGTRVAGAESKLGTVDSLSAAQKDLGNRMNNVEVMSKQNSDALKPLIGVNDRVGAVENKLGTLDTINKQVNDLNEGMAGVNQKLGRLDSLDARLGKVENLEPQIADSAQRVATLEGQLGQTRADVAGVSSNIKVLQSQHDDTVARIGKLENVGSRTPLEPVAISGRGTTPSTRGGNVP
jgi:predicted  nucleic acid-binding Zn-ribbon protein